MEITQDVLVAFGTGTGVGFVIMNSLWLWAGSKVKKPKKRVRHWGPGCLRGPSR